ncbi:hypothetical protein [Thalassobaculum litoreum]|uniref:MobA/MobL family protein n=1 Tax=Thalassobaculum litoreum DSM 18839 TaxID=1123362 RepID=A0A8G2F053_9PROT|nr:hypothetical protein [Thalassobaculum litoreum]SDG50903.1 hypothetical protein SAMN05660686_04666 [Thalassobaculum litoreum DSM 18839]
MSHARDIKGPWLNAEVMNRTPQVHTAFDRSRDPMIARQLDDLEKTESQRRGESDGPVREFSKPAARQDKPEPALKPPPHMRGRADRDGWLTAERSAAFARAETMDAGREPAPEQDRTLTRDFSGPSL